MKQDSLRPINSWYGDKLKTGEWIPESVATNMTRDISRIVSFKDNKGVRSGPSIRVEQELVHVHGGYRPAMEGEKKTRKSFFFRGARIWRDAA